MPSYEIEKSEAQWREELSPEEYEVCRNHGTEHAFTGRYWDHKEDGIYECVGCGEALFDSNTKYDSGSGWPSYYEGMTKIKEIRDTSFGMERVEILCPKCGSHLGHVFPDGPQPTGLRYCVNSLSLNFKKRQ
jgi:peptide-methionine (R)-S-oxide reductase